MWRINNFMLAIVLAATIIVGALGAIQIVSWQFEEYKRQTVPTERALNASDGSASQLISLDSLISHETWDEWSIVRVTQVTSDAPLGGGDAGLLGTMSSRAHPIYERFSNNLVLRNKNTGEERILFEDKAAIIETLKLISAEVPGIAVAYADSDTNNDGKIDRLDNINLKHVRFGDTVPTIITFDGSFSSFKTFKEDDDVFYFSAFADNNDNREHEWSREKQVIFEVSLKTGDIKQSVSDNTVQKLQAILDGAQE